MRMGTLRTLCLHAGVCVCVRGASVIAWVCVYVRVFVCGVGCNDGSRTLFRRDGCNLAGTQGHRLAGRQPQGDPGHHPPLTRTLMHFLGNR